jgi:hypothetical protein
MRAIPSLSFRSAVLTALVSPLVPALARAGERQPPPISPAGLADIRFEKVAWDEPGDGATWARGESYKASFGPRGAQYAPAFGPRQPADVVMSLSPASVKIAGSALAFDGAAEETRSGDSIQFERGAFVERWDLGVDTVEQSFVFASLPALGELVLTIPVGADIAGSTHESGIVFESELGRVEYSRAVAIDADGRRSTAATEWIDGAIVIRVDADFVQSARLPLVVDPVVTTVHFDSTTSDTFSPDATWSQSDGSWLVVYEVVYSATDHDVYARQMNSAGVFAAGDWVDFTTNSWNSPRCAAIPANDRMIVVAEQSTAVPKGIWGRPVILSGTTVTFAAQFNIAGTLGGDKSAPDVGGDPSLSGFRYACVAWTRTNSTSDSDIGYALVDVNGTVQVGPTYLSHTAGTKETSVSVSKSNGSRNWVIAYVHTDSFSLTFSDIWAARIDDTGAVTNPPFVVASSQLFEYSPSVSSPLSGTDRNLVTFRQNGINPSQSDIGVVAIDGATVLQRVNLSVLENAGTQGVDQTDASVDSDGTHFLVGYSEKVPAFGYYDLYCTDLFLSGNEIRPAQAHVFAYNISLPVLHCQVAATGGFGATAHRYAVPFDITGNSTDHDVSATLFDGSTGGTNELYCYGDGTGVACPCGNSGASTHGCAHSASAIGSWLLQTAGNDSVASDDVVLRLGNIPGGTPCLFFQGTAQSAGSAFGDGLLCVGGTITRLAVAFSVSGIATCPPGLVSLGGIPPTGGMRTYQVWYRDADPTFCTASTFNLSNGLAIYWAP